MLDLKQKLLDVAELSSSNKRKVGAILVCPNGIVYQGYNHIGYDKTKECEIDNVTLDSVVHAEEDVILQAAKDGSATNGAWLYITHSPCEHCANLIIKAGITVVSYIEEYKSIKGLEILNISGINVKKLKK